MGAYALLWDETSQRGLIRQALCAVEDFPPQRVPERPPEDWKDGIRGVLTDQNDPQVRASAHEGAASAYKVLQSTTACGCGRQQAWLDWRHWHKKVVIGRAQYFLAFLTFAPHAQVKDPSGGLLFALCCAAELVQDQLKKQVVCSYAATGVLAKRHGIWVVCPVSKINAKLEAALQTLEEGSRIFYPRAHDRQPQDNVEPIDPDLKAELAAKLVLCPVDTVEEAIKALFGSVICGPPPFPGWILPVVLLLGLAGSTLAYEYTSEGVSRMIKRISPITLSAPVRGVILSPTSNTVVTGPGTVETQIFLPNTYAAAAIVPSVDGRCWVQHDGRRVTPAVPLSLPVDYGGRDTYEVYVGVTYDADLFQGGAALPRCPEVDSKGDRVYWIGPVKVAHE